MESKNRRGKEYDKSNLTGSMQGFSRFDFRDPKIWRNADGSYSCILGNRPADGSGQILLFTSPDGFQWKYKKVLCTNNHRFGLMRECPDFFELDGKPKTAEGL